jgi:hypothetical protein
MKIAKISYRVIILLLVLGIPSLLFGGSNNTFLDLVSKKIHKETKYENDRNINITLQFSNVTGRRLMDVVSPDFIEKIYIPYRTKITPEQISYLLQHAVFRAYKELPATHLGPTGMFSMFLGNQVFLTFHMYAGAPMIRVVSDLEEYWLEIPDHEKFYALKQKGD